MTTQDVVYQRRRARRKSENLPEIDERQAKLLIEALENLDHEFRRAAERALRGFAKDVEKAEKTAQNPQGISINAAAEEFNVPSEFLWRWAKERGIIPILSEGKGSGSPTFIDRDKAEEIAQIYHEAKQLGIQPIKLYESKFAEAEILPEEQPDRLITLAEASQTYGIPLGTLYNYLSDGELTVRGRQVSPAPGGGKVLIDAEELSSLLQHRRPRGRPKKNPRADQ